MLSVGILASGLKIGTMRAWVQLGCVGSAFMLTAIMTLGQFPLTIPLEFAVVGLGIFNGMFAVAAIGSMGIYEQAKQRLNVNRGFGYLAYPGRVGMWPEISVITLKKAKATV